MVAGHGSSLDAPKVLKQVRHAHKDGKDKDGDGSTREAHIAMMKWRSEQSMYMSDCGDCYTEV